MKFFKQSLTMLSALCSPGVPVDLAVAVGFSLGEMLSGKFLALDVATLQTMQATWIACLNTIAVGNQSYSIAGRNFTRANLSDVTDTLAEISYALKVNSGGLARTVYADMS